MEILSDDPTYLVGALGILAAVFLVLMRVTQQGKFLLWAVVAGALALLVLGIDWIWVTDNERIAAVVEDVRRAVKASDADGVIRHLTPDARVSMSSESQFSRLNLLTGDVGRAFIREALANSRFEIVRLSHLRINAGSRTQRGTAEFRVFVNASYRGMHGTHVSDWSFGLRKTGPNVWQIERITPMRFPNMRELLVNPGESAEDERPSSKSQLLVP
jgi:hypothetical protein